MQYMVNTETGPMLSGRDIYVGAERDARISCDININAHGNGGMAHLLQSQEGLSRNSVCPRKMTVTVPPLHINQF